MMAELTINWSVYEKPDGFWVSESMSLITNKFGPIPDRTTAEELILHRRLSIIQALQRSLPDQPKLKVQ
jgi:hypothetical protein